MNKVEASDKENLDSVFILHYNSFFNNTNKIHPKFQTLKQPFLLKISWKE